MKTRCRITGYCEECSDFFFGPFIFCFIYMVYYIDRLSYVEPSLHLWDKAYLVMVDNVFDVFLESVCQYFIEYFCINVHEGDCLTISWCLFILGEFSSSRSSDFSKVRKRNECKEEDGTISTDITQKESMHKAEN
ncbi:hypothetical protein STEG23_036800 [Scotinomys teguina]